MIYHINTWWLVLLVITPFLLGLLYGIRFTKHKITMKLMQKLSIEEIEKLLESEKCK